MTTIAWDGRTLAADRAAWIGGAKYRVRKVHRVKHATRGDLLVGLCGDGGFAEAVLEWLRGGAHPGEYPERDKTYTVALIVARGRKVWRLDSKLRWQRSYGRIHATGAGAEMALGAMEVGATARRAIRVVMKHSDYAGIGIDAVAF